MLAFRIDLFRKLSHLFNSQLKERLKRLSAVVPFLFKPTYFGSAYVLWFHFSVAMNHRIVPNIWLVLPFNLCLTKLRAIPI